MVSKEFSSLLNLQLFLTLFFDFFSRATALFSSKLDASIERQIPKCLGEKPVLQCVTMFPALLNEIHCPIHGNSTVVHENVGIGIYKTFSFLLFKEVQNGS